VQVSFWVPIVVALIAAMSGMLGARIMAGSQRAATEAEREARETEVAVSGLAALVNELQEERKECKAELAQVTTELRACAQRVREIEQELIT
jgi:septal ring factor EnvC (AmiA/AmiB activator)